MIDKQIWFWSDTHFHHKNIVRGVTNWEVSEAGQKTRDFNTLEEHDEALIKAINDHVKQHDELWLLGDFSFGGIEQIWNFRKRIICQNIHLILGNHDHHIENFRILPNCEYNKANIIVDSINPSKGFEVGASGLFKSVQHVYFGKIGNQTFFLSHYSHRVWNGSHKGVVHLYGHSHDTLDDTGVEWGKSMDVSVESSIRIFGKMRPFNIGDIHRIMNKREINIVDHHNSSTS